MNDSPRKPPAGVQTFVHFLEEGTGRRWMKGALFLILAGLAVTLYQWNAARNFEAPDAMDAAQLGRRIAAGGGYTTDYVRPLSLYLLETRAAARGVDPGSFLPQPHPDLQNPPVYPVLLAGVLKLVPEAWRTALPPDQFRRRPFAEMAISVFNLGVFAAVLWLIWQLGARLFDPLVAWIATWIAVGTEMFWNLANSGLPTMVLMAMGLVLFHVMVSAERECASVVPRPSRAALWAIAAGAVVGLMFLTKYAFGWLVLPVASFFLWRRGYRSLRLAFLTVLAAGLVASPWIARNVYLSGAPFGTATFAAVAGTTTFPGDRLERSQHPAFERSIAVEVLQKTTSNLRDIAGTELLKLGGGWITAFFLAGLLAAFQNPLLNRLRLFFLSVLAILAIAQAGGQTWLTKDFGPFTGENLLIVFAPIIVIYGTGFLITLFDHIEWPQTDAKVVPFATIFMRNQRWGVESPESGLRYATLVLIIGLLSLPFLLSLLPPAAITLRDPPYRPAVIREIAQYSPPGTLFMSDIPWAVAWYGPRECLAPTLTVLENPQANVANRREDFFVFTDGRRPVEAVYLSPYWANQPLRDRFLLDPDFAWGRFYLDVLTRQALPDGFPLKHVLGPGYMENGHFLVASKNWWHRSSR